MDNDQFGRTVTMETVGDLDIYTVGDDLFELKYPTGTSVDQVYRAINAMAPPDYTDVPSRPVTKYKGFIQFSGTSVEPEVLLPVDVLTGAQGIYQVGQNEIDVFLNGQHLSVGSDYDEVGADGTYSDQIQMHWTLENGDVLEFQRK